MTIALSVNLNKIALLRNSREGDFPSPLEFAQICLDAGARGLTVHPRPDQRHIRPADVLALAERVHQCDGVEFNIEGNPFAQAKGTYPGLTSLVEHSAAHQCTLVPDSHTQLTSDHGFDLRRDGDRLLPVIERLHAAGVRVSLFMDPDLEQISLAKQIGADRIELYTGPYAHSFALQDESLDDLFERYRAAAERAVELGLGVNAGHDLNLENLPRFTQIPGLAEVSIGHALTVDALRLGMHRAVGRYLEICAAV